MKSKETVESLIKSIKTATGLKQEQIAEKIGYQREYLSQAKKTDSPKLISLLKSVFKEDLEKISEVESVEEPDQPEPEREVIQLLRSIQSNLTDTKQNVLLNQAIGRSQLQYLASLEAEKTENQEEKFLDIVKAQNESIEAFLREIYRVRRGKIGLRVEDK